MKLGELEGDQNVLARLSEFQRTGDIDSLWPDIAPGERRAASAKIRTAIAGVAGGGGSPPVLTATNRHEARAISVSAFMAGVGPLLAWWMEEGRVEASPLMRESFASHLEQGRLRSALLRGHVARLVSAMRGAGARPILLKGLHTGAEFFPDPCTRPAADVDLLIHPSERMAASNALRDLGFEETRRTVFGGRSEWSPSGRPMGVRSIEVDHVENPWNIDLHEALVRWYFRGTRRDLGEAPFSSTRVVRIDGEEVRVLDQPYLMAFLSMHAGYDLTRIHMVRLLELVFVIRGDTASGQFDWASFAALLERRDLGRFVYPALRLVEDLVPGTVEPILLHRLDSQVSRRMHRVLEAVRRAELGALREPSLDVKLAWAVGMKELAMNISDLLIPSDDGGTLLEIYRRRMPILGRRITRRLAGRRSPTTSKSGPPRGNNGIGA